MATARQVGRYRLHEPIGRGGVARVWRATQLDTGRPAAVKVLTPASARRPAAAQSIHRDVRFAGALLHPRIIFLYDHGLVADDEQDDALVAGSPWVAMALADGSADRMVGRWAWPEVAQALDQLLDGLAYAHARGVVHGDIKPQNLLLHDGNLLIADFGMAGARRHADDVGPSGGTPGFMAPEQLGERPEPLGPWTDLYAVAATAMSLVGDQPVPEGFASWVARLMVDDPAERYRFACDAREALARLGPAVAPLAGHRPGMAAATLDLFEPFDAIAPAAEPAPRVRAPTPTGPPPEPVVRGEAGGSLFGIRPPPLVGRAAEQQALWSLLRRVVAERAPRLVYLDGAPGTGTSRLSSWLLTAAHAHGVGHVVRIRFAGGATDSLLDLLMALLACRQRPDRVAGAVHLLGEPLTMSDVPVVQAWMAGRQVASAAKHALVARAVAASRGGRVGVLAIDPGADPEQAARLGRALLDVDYPLLVVWEGPATLSGERVHRVAVEPLGASEQHALLQALVGELGEVPAWAVAASKGRPADAVAMAREWVRLGRLPTDPSSGGPRPWAERLAELTPSDRRALHVAHVLGLPVAADEWQQACEHADVPSDPTRLGRLIDLGFLIERGHRLELAHPLLARAMERRSSDDDASLHRAAAAALDHLGAPSHRSVRHWVAAGEAVRVVDQLAAALNELATRGKLVTARGLAKEAEHQLRFMDRPDSDPIWGELAHAALRVEVFGGRDEQALAAARDAVRRAERHDWPTKAPLLNLLGRFALDASHLDEAREALERALCYRDHPLHTVVATNLAMVCYRAGDVARGLELFDEAEATATSDGTTANAVRGRGMFRHRQGRLDEAHACYERAYELYEAEAELTMMSVLANDLGEVSRHRGDLADARRWFERAIDIASSLEAADRGVPTANLALVCRAEGDEGRADELLAASHQVCMTTGRPGPGRLIDALRAPCALALRDWGRLRRHLDSAQSLLDHGWRDPDAAEALRRVAESTEAPEDLVERARHLAAGHTGPSPEAA